VPNAVAQKTMDEWLKDSPELKHIDGTRRGYIELSLSPTKAQARLFAVENQREASSPCREVKSLELQLNDPHIG